MYRLASRIRGHRPQNMVSGFSDGIDRSSDDMKARPLLYGIEHRREDVIARAVSNHVNAFGLPKKVGGLLDHDLGQRWQKAALFRSQR